MNPYKKNLNGNTRYQKYQYDKVDTQLNDDLELMMESTWLESTGTGYDRVVVLNFFTSDLYDNSHDVMLRTMGTTLRKRVSDKLEEEIGIKHKEDYIFAIYDNPKMKDGSWMTSPVLGEQRTVIRIRDEEHFTMFKLHYNG